jgi:peptidoglycan/xylan/chitin deacetylase (PgdA/CDA1 family)
VNAPADVLVLCYHAVSARWRSELSITPHCLERQLEHVLACGYEPATFTRAVLDPPASRTVAVTFDDAFRSVYDVAAPVLARAGVPATVFVPTALIDGGAIMTWPGLERWAGGPHAEELAGMTWPQLVELADAGWEIGSHTRTHARLPELGDDALQAELAGSRAECTERTGRACEAVAYPYGDVDARVVAAAGVAGYHAAASPAGPSLGSAALAFPRIGLYERDEGARLRAKVSPRVRRLQRSTLWPAVAGAARAVGV